MFQHVRADDAVESLAAQRGDRCEGVIAHHAVDSLRSFAREVCVDLDADDGTPETALNVGAEGAVRATYVEDPTRRKGKEGGQIGPRRGVRLDAAEGHG